MSARRQGTRPGFSLIELMIVVLVVGIIASIAVPHYRKILLKAQAADAIGSIEVVKVAAFNYFMENTGWPADVNRGQTPPELVPFLPPDFSFDQGEYLLDWDNWTLPDGTPTKPGTGVQVGISLVTTDTLLGNAFLDLLGGGVSRFTIGDHYTLIIEAP